MIIDGLNGGEIRTIEMRESTQPVANVSTALQSMKQASN